MQKAKFKERLKLPKEARLILYQCAIFALGMVLMPVKFMFGTYPFGLALVSACKKHTPFAFAGALFSVIFFMKSSPVYIVALIGIFALRMVSSLFKRNEIARATLGEKTGGKIAKIMFCEGIELKVSIGALCALGIGIYNVIANGYLYYDIFVLVFSTVFLGIMTYAFSGAFEGQAKKRSFLFAMSSFSFALAYALSGREIHGVDLSIVLSYAIVLYLSRHISGTVAGSVGLILGLVQGAFAPAFAIGGIVSGFLWGVSPYLAIMSGFIMSMGYGIFASGYEAVVILASELLFASLVMYPLLRFEIIPKPSFLSGTENKTIGEYHLETKGKEMKDRLSLLSSSYNDIAKIFRGLSTKTKNPEREAYMDMALETCEGYCYNCPKESICWERDTITTQENINKMGEAIFVNSQVLKGDVDEKFLHRCPNIDKIMEELNKKRRDIVSEGIKNDKLEISACDYELTAKIIASMLDEGELKRELNKEMTDKSIKACARCGLVIDKIEVLGKDSYEIIASGVDIQRSRCTEAELVRELENSLKISLSEPEIESDGAFATIRIKSKRAVDIKTYQASSVLDGGDINGDTVSVFEGYNNKFYMLICDGMGSGREAGLTSQMCADFLEKILSVTNEKDLALSMLNMIVRAKNLECSSTVDLLELDLTNAEGRFVKSGASPSFIKRGDKVFKLQSKTAPIGIMKRLDAEQLSFSLSRGDLCVMVSDGVVSGKSWLIELLKGVKEGEIETLPNKIIEKAKSESKIKDDMSVTVLLVE